MKRGVMVAATRQHVGKTTTCLALMSGLRKVFGERVGFLKPVGQTHVLIESGLKVDKDVRLFKEHFNMHTCEYTDMSPVVIPPGYTRRFLDGYITEEDQVEAIKTAFGNLCKTNEFTLVEGTGHCGVGSIVNLDNARVASILGLDMVLVVNGGLGSAFDELALNVLMCKERNVKVKGVLINKVQPGKVGMISEYFAKALKRWSIPMIGVVPDAAFLERPTMLDFQTLFDQTLMSRTYDGQELWHYDKTTLVAMSLKKFLQRLQNEAHSKTLFVTHGSREDLVLGFISHGALHTRIWGKPWRAGMILAGELPEQAPIDSVQFAIQNQSNPVLLSGQDTYATMNTISKYTAKLNPQDVNRTIAAIDHYEKYIDFESIAN